MALNNNNLPLSVSLLVNTILLFLYVTESRIERLATAKHVTELSEKLQDIKTIVDDNKKDLASIQTWSIQTAATLKKCDISPKQVYSRSYDQ